MDPTEAMRDEVLQRARELFRTEQAARAWYTLPSRQLGGTPEDLVAAGHGDQVLRLLVVLAQEAPAPPPSLFGFPLPTRKPRR